MKREVWQVIETLKRAQKCIILTTHGMDEADALCDRIGIMTQGQLRAVAPVAQLRARFGRVIQLTFIAKLSKEQKSVLEEVQMYDARLDAFLKSFHPNLVLRSAVGPSRVYVIDKSQVAEISKLFEYMQLGLDQGLYLEWGMSQTSLDEVFCYISEESEK